MSFPAIRLLTDLVWVQPLVAEKKIRGIVIPDTAEKKKIGAGVVVAVGPDCKTVKPGYTAYHGDYIGLECKYGGQKYFVMHENEISAYEEASNGVA